MLFNISMILHVPSLSRQSDHFIPANFFRVKCVRFSSRHDQDFRNRKDHFRRFPMIYQRRPNVAENIRRCSDKMASNPSNPNAN